jgi:uncharacterized heparinase superfamily protein
MTRADGSLHQFNDTAAGIAPPSRWLVDRATALTRSATSDRPATGTWLLPSAGYAGWRDAAAETQIVFDAGPPGPREQPGHAHCDALSFELCIHGWPIIVNAGVHGYDNDPYRSYSRGVRGHNAVQFDCEEQHEVWATFRVARFGTVVGPVVHDAPIWAVSGRVSGYADGTHTRRLDLLDASTLRVTDEVSAKQSTRAWSRLLLHPDFTVCLDDGVVTARRDGLQVRIASSPRRDVRLVVAEESSPAGWHFPTFGSKRPAVCVVTELLLPRDALSTVITWGHG